MATETLYASSLTSGTVTTSGNALGAPDGTYTTDSGQVDWTARFAIGNPVNGIANGTHTVTARVRKINGQSGTPVLNSITLYDGSTLLTTKTLSTNVTSGTSQDVATTFTESEVRAVANANNLEIEIVTTAAGGSGAARTPVQLDAITWSGDFTAAAINLVVQNAAQAAVADSPTLYTPPTLVVGATTQAQVSDSPALTQVHVLVVQSAAHAAVADSPTITQVTNTSLVVQNAAQAQSSTQPTLTEVISTNLVVQGAVQASVADSPTLVQVPTLIVQNAVMGQAAQAPVLFVPSNTALVVQNAVQAQVVTPPVLVHVVPSVWPPGPNQIWPPTPYPENVRFRLDGQDWAYANTWEEHYQLMWDGYLPG